MTVDRVSNNIYIYIYIIDEARREYKDYHLNTSEVQWVCSIVHLTDWNSLQLATFDHVKLGNNESA